MEHQFWKELWEKEQTGWHEEDVNPLLLKHHKALIASEESRIFIPLCGKTLDIGWFLANGHSVVGVELSELAIDQLFAELGVTPKITQIDGFKHYNVDTLDIFVGDFFKLTEEIIGKVDGIYDRGALVALPKQMREQYSQNLVSITKGAPQLLIVYEYDQSKRQGPPFAIELQEIEVHYKDSYQISLLSENCVDSELSQVCEMKEVVWSLGR